MQGVGGAQGVGGEGRGRPRGAGVVQPGQGVGRGDAALGVTVVEQEHQRFEGPPVARAAEPEGGYLAGPQGAARLHEDPGQLLGVLDADEQGVLRRPGRLGFQPVHE